MINREDVEAAARRTMGLTRRTPVARMEAGFFDFPHATWLKLEYLQHTGSFKARGAFNRLLAAKESGGLGAGGVVTASGGNAGLAVAYAAGTLGVPAEVYVPLTAPAHKVAKLKELGADVRQVGDEYAEANAAAVRRAEQTGALFCHAYDQPEICAGQGTLALEMLDQVERLDVERLDTVVLAVGGGGLMAGVAAALRGRARVVGVEPETIPTMHAALEAGHPVDVTVSGVAADALGARRLGEIAYRVAVDTGVRGVLVADQDIVEARRLLWERCRIVVEHAAAAAVAALCTGAYRPEPGERVGIVLCGANTDPADLAH